MLEQNNILFSIILPTYNRAKTIGQAIDSVVAQSYRKWELIIIDDGSTDNTKDIISSFTDQRIRYIYQKNQERSVARNNGIKIAKGEYICFLDSDDEYLIHHLETFYSFLTKQMGKYIGFMSTTGLIKHKGQNFKYPAVLLNHTFNTTEYIWMYSPSVPSVCCHKDILNQFKFNDTIRIGEDLDLWLRISNSFPYHQINKTTIQIYSTDDNTSNSFIHNPSEIKQYFDVLKKILSSPKKHPIRSKIKYEKINFMALNIIIKNIKKLNIKNVIYAKWLLLTQFPNLHFIPHSIKFIRSYYFSKKYKLSKHKINKS